MGIFNSVQASYSYIYYIYIYVEEYQIDHSVDCKGPYVSQCDCVTIYTNAVLNIS